jgi:hypothetical protein
MIYWLLKSKKKDIPTKTTEFSTVWFLELIAALA